MLIDAKTQDILRKKFEQELRETVDVKVFTRSILTGNEDPQYAQFSKDLVKELSEINPKIKGEFLSLESEEAKEQHLSVSPTILIGKDLGYSIEYWGAPAGHEASAFFETISLVSQGESGLDTSSKGKLEGIDQPVLLETYITLSCPYCPQAVLLSHRMAIQVPGKITSRYIEAQEVMDRAREFSVSSVPQQVINEEMDSVTIGVQPEGTFVDQVLLFGSSRAEEILSREKEQMKKQEELTDNPDVPIVLNEGNFDRAVDRYPFLVVDCWAEWCMPCRMVSPTVERLAKKHAGEITFGKLDVDGNQEIASRYGIMSIPTLLVFKNGEKVDAIVGALPENALEQKLRVHADGRVG
ncbi:MAG: thioredoxin [Candidatus Latescibacteria bacterium]|nr:thioredoxin [Candidatus Latescibacterota bacterium]